MRHINQKDDWFYEFRPYIIIGIGLAGLVNQLAGNTQGFVILNLLCSVTLLTLGNTIISKRKAYRKSSFMK